MRSGQVLGQGQRITSQNGKYYLIMQGDGNCVLYPSAHPGSSHHAMWHTNTYPNGCSATLTNSGQLQVKDRCCRVIYSRGCNTNICGCYQLIIENNGNIVICNSCGVQVWCSNTGVPTQCTPCNPTPCTPTPCNDNPLVAWWKLNEGCGSSTVGDSSGHGHNGTISGSSFWDNGLVFGGSEHNAKVSFGTKPSLHGTTNFSIHACVKTLSCSTGVILQQRSPGNHLTNGYSGEYRLSLVDGKPNFMLFGTSGRYQFDFTAPHGITDNRWHRLVAVREGREGRIYVDGKLVARASNQVESLDGNIPVFMGWDARDKVSYFSGTLKDVKIYKKAVIN